MKKMMKKLIAMAAALVMIVTLLPAVGVNATVTEYDDFDLEREGSITIHKTTQDAETPLAGAGFTLYKIVSFKVDDESGKIVVRDDSTVKSILPDGTDINTIDASDFRLPSSASEAATSYEDFTVYNAKGDDQRFTDEYGNLVFQNITAGIYVAVESTLPTGTEGTSYYESVPFLISIPSTTGEDENGNDYGNGENVGAKWVYDITASPKNNEAGGSKEITGVKDEDNSNVGSVDVNGDAASTQPGDTVEYVIRTTTPTKGTTFAVQDNLTNLEYDMNSLVVYDESNGAESATEIATTNYDISYVYKTPDNDTTPVVGFTVTFKQVWVDANPAIPIALKYTATVSEDAKVGTDDNTNEAIIKYDNNSNTLSDKPKVYTYGFVLTKEGEDSDLLNGVQCNLYRGSVADENKMNDQPLTTANGGKLTCDGLAAGTYYLEEIKTQDGYTLLANPVKIVITADGENVTAATATMTVDNVKTVGKVTDEDDGEVRFTFTIVNNKGFTLPATGGMGTYLFTIGGIVIMAGAAFALIAMKKRA